MNRYRLLDTVRQTSIVNRRDYYLQLMERPDVNAIALSIQEEKLVAFLKRLKKNALYKSYLEVTSDIDIENAPFDVLGSLPLADKEFLTDNYGLIKDKDIKGENSYTGGSTGSPFHFFAGKKMLSSLTGYTLFLWSYLGGYDWSDNTIVIGGGSVGDSKSLKKSVLHFLQRRKIISGGEITEENATKLANVINNVREPVFVYGYPSSICQYISLLDSLHLEINTNNIKKIITTSETLSDDRKSRLEQFFNKGVVNLYGARDGGISAGSIDNSTFIYNGIDCVAESIEIDGVNELVLTNLNSEAFPFVRYRIGDIATPNVRSTGYPFILTDLKGRTRDFIHISPTKKIHGSKINHLFMDFPIVEYQIFQHKDLSCDVFIQPRIVFNEDTLNDLSTRLQILLEGIPFTLSFTQTLKREQNNKLKNIISDVIN